MNDYALFVEALFFCNFYNKKGAVFIPTSVGTLKYDCVIKTRGVFSFLLLINNSFTILLSFSLFCISAVISSKKIKVYRFFFGLYSSMFL